VRRRIGIGKCSGDDWLRVMRVAHEEGMNTSCTMLIGHIEFVRERVEHMSALRDMQDYALALDGRGRMSDVGCGMSDVGRSGVEAVRDRVMARWPGVFARSHLTSDIAHLPSSGSYTAFIHWPFQRENTPLGRAKEWDEATYGPFDDSANEDILRGRVVRMAGADEYLRMLAIARLYFDNIANLQSSWVTMGPKVGQLALFFGANDMGSVMMEENVVSAAGTTYKLSDREICRLIRDAGWVPAQRDQYYKVLRRHEGEGSPDLVAESPAVREVKWVGGEYVGSAPGIASQAEATRVQLRVLGEGN
jgi:cyclic dehypoxanthinyl futalosine synthase